MSANLEEKKSVNVDGPFTESELIVRWAQDRAYKIVYAGVDDINKLTVQEINSNGQKEGMLTKLLVDTTLELFKINEIHSSYYEPGKKVDAPKS